MENIDEIDMNILKMLVENGRVNLSEMAEEVGLSSSGLRRRVKTLEEKEIIKRYTTKIDPEKAGYGEAAYLHIDVRSSESGRIAGILTRCKGVCEVHKTTGDHGLTAKVRAKDRTQISKFVEDEVSTYKGVKDVDITMTIETYKEDLLNL